MSHTFTSLHYHVIFSTRGRKNLIPQDALERLHGYVGGMVRNINGLPLAIGGTMNHLHVLATFKTAESVGSIVGKIKSNSSRWAHQEIPSMADFAWQDGYGAFTVSRSRLDQVAGCIAGQMAHHGAMSFEEEFVRFLRRHGIAFDERNVWG